MSASVQTDGCVRGGDTKEGNGETSKLIANRRQRLRRRREPVVSYHSLTDTFVAILSGSCDAE